MKKYINIEEAYDQLKDLGWEDFSINRYDHNKLYLYFKCKGCYFDINVFNKVYNTVQDYYNSNYFIKGISIELLDSFYSVDVLNFSNFEIDWINLESKNINIIPIFPKSIKLLKFYGYKLNHEKINNLWKNYPELCVIGCNFKGARVRDGISCYGEKLPGYITNNKRYTTDFKIDKLIKKSSNETIKEQIKSEVETPQTINLDNLGMNFYYNYWTDMNIDNFTIYEKD